MTDIKNRKETGNLKREQKMRKETITVMYKTLCKSYQDWLKFCKVTGTNIRYFAEGGSGEKLVTIPLSQDIKAGVVCANYLN